MNILLRRKAVSVCNHGLRRYCQKVVPPKGLRDQPDPSNVSHNYIGPPDKYSNLRPVVRHIPENETPLAKRYREKQIEVDTWNHEFWTRHNKRFYEDKEVFIKVHQIYGKEISADKMSEFYKKFLDKNWSLHFYYNVSWYLKNFDLLTLAMQTKVQSLWLKLKH